MFRAVWFDVFHLRTADQGNCYPQSLRSLFSRYHAPDATGIFQTDHFRQCARLVSRLRGSEQMAARLCLSHRVGNSSIYPCNNRVPAGRRNGCRNKNVAQCNSKSGKGPAVRISESSRRYEMYCTPANTGCLTIEHYTSTFFSKTVLYSSSAMVDD